MLRTLLASAGAVCLALGAGHAAFVSGAAPPVAAAPVAAAPVGAPLVPAPPRVAVAPAPASAPARVVGAGCEPSAPIDVQVALPDDARAGRVPLDFRVAPLVEARELRWEWLLPDGVLLVEGERETAVELARGAEHLGRVVVDLPHDGRARGVVLRVSAVVEGSDETGATWPERVVEERFVGFGAPTTNAVPARGPDREAPGLADLWVVPSRHRAGR